MSNFQIGNMIDLEGYDGFTFRNSRMFEIFEAVQDYARQGQPLILFGPSGAGKEFLSRYYYAQYRKATGFGGKFLSLNCAGLGRETAHSELFGHVKGSFTDAYRDQPGHFELAENGVLFLDEIGNLDESVQMMLNRAMDEKTSEARRLGAEHPYSTRSTRVICATEKGRDSLQDALLYRAGLQIQVPGLDDRPEDVAEALIHFSKRALWKRLDHQQVLSSILKINSGTLPESILEDPAVEALAGEISRMLTPLVQARQWPGNFRALRTAVDSGVIRAKNTSSPTAFVSDVCVYFNQHLGDFSKSLMGGSAPLPSPGKGHPPRHNPWPERVQKKVPRFKLDLQTRLAGFLHEYEGTPFTREVFERQTGLSERQAQMRIKDLKEVGILEDVPGQRNVYRVCSPGVSRGKEMQDLPSFLALPEPTSPPSFVDPSRVREAALIFENAGGLLIRSGDPIHRAQFLSSLGKELGAKHPVGYFSFEEHGLEDFIRASISYLDEQETEGWFRGKESSSIPDSVLAISGHMSRLLNATQTAVIILDYIDTFYTSESQEIIEKLVHYWNPVKFILGAKRQFFHSSYARKIEFMELEV